MKKSLIIAEASDTEIINARKACFDKNVSAYIVHNVSSGLDALDMGPVFSAVIIDLYVPLDFLRTEKPQKIPQGLTLALKCLELNIPFLIISNDTLPDLFYLKMLIKTLENHPKFQQNIIPCFLGVKNWSLIISEALNLDEQKEDIKKVSSK